MRSLKLSKIKLLLVVSICLGLAFGVVIWASGKRRSTSQSLNIRVLNRTTTATITEIQPRGEDVLKLKITNESSQNLLAYTLAVGRSSDITYFTFSLSPGESRLEQVAISNLKERADGTKTREVALAAVYFADGTTDGDPIRSSRLLNRMLGIQEQARRVLAVLHKSSASVETNAERLLQDLSSEINKSEEILDASPVPTERLAGRDLIKQKVARGINELNNKKDAPIHELKDQIRALAQQIEETSSIRHIRKEKGEQK